jgi:hypothetical protein
MPSIRNNSRAAALLAELREEDGLSLERLALLTGSSADDLRGCRDHKQTLPPVAQVRLARTIATRVPRLSACARRLEEQAAAAASVESGSTTLHLTAPAKWR